MHDENLYKICNAAGYHYLYKHKRSTHEDDYYTCPHYDTVSTTISTLVINNVAVNVALLCYTILTLKTYLSFS